MLRNSLEEVNLELDLSLAASHDSAPVNLASVRFLQDQHQDLFDLPCTSHILDCAGKHFAIPDALAFVSKFNDFLARGNGEVTWVQRMGYSFGTISETRWWSWYEHVRPVLVMPW